MRLALVCLCGVTFKLTNRCLPLNVPCLNELHLSECIITVEHFSTNLSTAGCLAAFVRTQGLATELFGFYVFFPTIRWFLKHMLFSCSIGMSHARMQYAINGFPVVIDQTIWFVFHRKSFVGGFSNICTVMTMCRASFSFQEVFSKHSLLGSRSVNVPFIIDINVMVSSSSTLEHDRGFSQSVGMKNIVLNVTFLIIISTNTLSLCLDVTLLPLAISSSALTTSTIV